VKQLKITNQKQLLETAEKYAEARNRAAEAKNEQTKAGLMLKKYLNDNGLTLVKIGDYTVTKTDITSKKFDLEQFKADHPKTKFEPYETITVTERLNVKEAKE
jgi:hypothetical protein